MEKAHDRRISFLSYSSGFVFSSPFHINIMVQFHCQVDNIIDEDQRLLSKSV